MGHVDFDVREERKAAARAKVMEADASRLRKPSGKRGAESFNAGKA